MHQNGQFAYASDRQVRVFVGDKPLETDIVPRLINGRVLVPLRPVFEAIGGRVSYDPLTGSAMCTIGQRVLMIEPGEMKILVNGQEVALPFPPVLERDRIMMPLRVIADLIGTSVVWDGLYGVAALVLDGKSPADLPSLAIPSQYKEEDVELLARLINAEAGRESYEGQLAVGAVVVNRTKSGRFPDKIAEVIYQPGQFHVIGNRFFEKSPPESAVRAAIEALMGKDPTNGALFFFNPKKATVRAMFSRPVTVTIGNHRFCK